MQRRLLEVVLPGGVVVDEAGGGVEVPLRGRQSAEFVVDSRPRHEHLAQSLVEPVPAGQAGGLVQQHAGTGVGQSRPFRPGLGAQGDHQGFAVTGASRLEDQGGGVSPEVGRIGVHAAVGRVRPSEQIRGAFAFHRHRLLRKNARTSMLVRRPGSGNLMGERGHEPGQAQR